MMPFWGCGKKSIVLLGPVQFGVARSYPHGVVRRVFRYEVDLEERPGEIDV